MQLKDLSNEELQREYTFLLIEIENKYSTKKEFEEEMKRRFRQGQL